MVTQLNKRSPLLDLQGEQFSTGRALQSKIWFRFPRVARTSGENSLELIEI